MKDLYPSGAGLEAGGGYLGAFQCHCLHLHVKPKVFVDHSKSSTHSAHVDSGLKSQVEAAQSALKS